jgi:hypothetical protein
MIDKGSGNVVAAIRAKIASRTLPLVTPQRVSVSPGMDLQCDACDQPITAADTEYDIGLPGDRVLRFHRPCFNIWHVERAKARMESAPVPVAALLVTDGFICQGCLALKTGMSREEVIAAIEVIGPQMRVISAEDNCRQCGALTRVFKM